MTQESRGERRRRGKVGEGRERRKRVVERAEVAVEDRGVYK